ncbi:MAG TPA: DUF6067 family protein [Sphingobacterium sp.]|nr:DUF6067 family protein [Sphingobacterium sp.]
MSTKIITLGIIKTFIVIMLTGNVYAQTFTELPDPTADTLSDWSAVPKGLQASFVSIDKRYPKSACPEVTPETSAWLTAWKGEKVSAQLLLWIGEDIGNVQVSFGDFRSKDGNTLSADIAQARFVRYVMTDEFGKGCGKRKPEDYTTSLSPDMLDNLSKFDLEAKNVRPVWVTVEVPRTAKAGKYKAEVQITGKTMTSKKLSLELEVIDQILPRPSEWSFHLDQWQHPSAIARVDGLSVWSDEHFNAMKPVMQLLADAGQKVITATLNKDPWNVQTFDPYEDMIIWTKHSDGSWSYDYTVFDRWVEFMMDIGFNKMINCYSLIPWNNEIHYKDEAKGEFVNVKADPGTPVFKQFWGSFLTDFSRHLEKKGWLGITNISMDERDQKSLDAAFHLIDSVAPRLGVSFADNKRTYQRYPNSRDISVSSQDPISHEDLIDRRARGLNTTFYVYCATPFPNQFTFSDPAESTYLAWYAMAAGFDGFLRWAFNSWVENPLHDSRFRTWPAGDTYIVYPQGRSSIRYERMVEGIQDYEKVKVVRKALEEQGKKDALQRLDSAIQKLNNPNRRDGWNQELNDAKKLLNELAIIL